jgi:hypothetical protein
MNMQVLNNDYEKVDSSTQINVTYEAKDNDESQAD